MTHTMKEKINMCNRCGVIIPDDAPACYHEFKKCKECWGKPSLLKEIKGGESMFIIEISRNPEEVPNKLRFPNGLRYRYWKTKIKYRCEKWFCYSTTRNRNGKFVSWVYIWKGNVAEPKKVVEHRRRKDAKKRAYKLYLKEKHIL